MYIEASSPRKREDNAKLYSPPLAFPGHMCLEFYYHMSGAAIGSLKVTIDEKVVFSRSGDREDKWYKASINVSAIVGWHRYLNYQNYFLLPHVTFEGVVGNGYRGDIAIDDFSLTARSCAFNCCSYHFEKYQDLSTSSAHAVEHFTINGDLFLAFANYKSDTTGKYNIDSFIYKFNDSTRKFSPYQNISTSGGQDVEYFKISDEHYLAVANGYNGVTHRLNSVIYRWNGKLFVAFQNLTTQGANGFTFFVIDKEPFLAVSNRYDDVTNQGINSVIYRWKNKRFELFQEVATDGSNRSVAFLISNENYIAFANNVKDSVVYKWSGKSFFKLQTLPKANDLKFFNISDNAFLAISSPNENPLIYE
ncbi:unnamed protein product [Porites lobata]|uniref:MAM domain-containing protein n=1 Tax=Porites lobata TaxID=104759 RepID=A0ABN8R712_9CNID|nr:unnamed protein product [Porites lobata]